MPRASNGTYTLPAGNPVVTGTVVASAWANNTLSDIGTVLSDSLSRSGSGGMTAPLQLTAGAVGAPGLTWSLETTSGFYRNAAADFRFAIGAVDKIQFNTNGLLVADGAVATPGHSFISDPDTGLYRIGANNLGLATAGVLALSIDATQHCLFIDGTVALPAISFIADSDTGIFRNAANNLRLVTGGVSILEIGSNVTVNSGVLRSQDGAVGTPGFSFDLDTDTGMYRAGANVIAFSTGGVFTGGFSSSQQLIMPDGSAALPSITFNADNDTGMYRTSTNNPAFSANGALVFQYDPFGIYNKDGTSANPSWTFTADADTGFYRTTANQIAIALGGGSAGEIAQGTFTGTLTGCTTSPTGTFTWQRVGNLVTLNFPALSATSNATTLTITGLPAVIQPATLNQWVRMASVVQNNGVTVATTDVVFSALSGTIQFANASSLSGWTNVSNKGLVNPASVSYLVA